MCRIELLGTGKCLWRYVGLGFLAAGRYTYVMHVRADRRLAASAGAAVAFDAAGRAVLMLEFQRPGAHLVLFGVND